MQLQVLTSFRHYCRLDRRSSGRWFIPAMLPFNRVPALLQFSHLFVVQWPSMGQWIFAAIHSGNVHGSMIDSASIHRTKSWSFFFLQFAKHWRDWVFNFWRSCILLVGIDFVIIVCMLHQCCAGMQKFSFPWRVALSIRDLVGLQRGQLSRIFIPSPCRRRSHGSFFGIRFCGV